MDKIERIACLYLTFLNAKALSFTKIRDYLSGAYEGEAETARRKFERDKESLRDLGIELATIKPGEYLKDGSTSSEFIYYLKNEVSKIPEISLSNREAQYLSGLILGILGNGESDFLTEEEKKSLESATFKIFYQNPASLSNVHERLPQTLSKFIDNSKIKSSKSDLLLIHEALQKKRQLIFRYENKSQVTSMKTVNPQGLISRQSRWCLVAWSHDKKQIRYFYLDQMSSIELKEESFKLDKNFNINDYNLHVLSVNIHEPQRVMLKYRPEAEDRIVNFLKNLPKRFNLKEKGEYEFEFFTSNKNALFSYLLSHPSDITNLGPLLIHNEYKDHLHSIKQLNGCKTK